MRATVTFREGDRLWPLVALLLDTHIDDLDEKRMREVEMLIEGWRITHADGSRFEPNEPRVRSPA